MRNSEPLDTRPGAQASALGVNTSGVTGPGEGSREVAAFSVAAEVGPSVQPAAQRPTLEKRRRRRRRKRRSIFTLAVLEVIIEAFGLRTATP